MEAVHTPGQLGEDLGPSGVAAKAAPASVPSNGLRLGGARADFVAGLGRKVVDLRATSSKVREAPEDLPRREELRRKLHALSSSAKIMKFDSMDRAIAEALGTIDRTAIDMPLDAVDLDAIEQILEDLPALAWGDGDARVSRIEPVAKPSAPSHSALVVGSALMAEALLDEPPAKSNAENAAPHYSFTCESTPDAQAAFDLARTTEPDLVLLDADLDYSVELVEALMDDPLTEVIPIVVVGSFLEAGEAARYVAMGVAKTLAKPTSKSSLRAVCEAALQAHAASLPRIAVIGNPAVAAASAIQYTTDVARGDRSRARLRGPATEVRLQGRRVVIADDDPAVVWFLADLLKTQGCIIHEAFDGKQALELAYRTSPDLVVCDIMMPGIDGFTLCRALRRDVALRDVPVMLLSWKEDLLQRVRELGAGAAGYLRKESDTRAIVARIREALRPRAHIEMRLRDDDGEARGRLDGISVRTLLEIVCATRPEARVCVRDASFNYEVEVRDGAPQKATRTSGDGTFLDGSRVLAAMLGVGAGRFTVTTCANPIEAQLDGNLAAQLAKPIARARAAMALLVGPSAMKTSRVILDEEMLEDYLRAMPTQAREIALRIADGTPPRALVMEGACDAALVEDITCDLAARGVVIGVVDESGADLLTPEVARIALYTDTRAAFAPRTATPMPSDSACTAEDDAAICESPEPGDVNRATRQDAGGSLEDAVMNEIGLRSPEPMPLELPAERLRAVAKRDEYEGTPSPDQILAFAEATVIDNTVYGTEEDDDGTNDPSQMANDDVSHVDVSLDGSAPIGSTASRMSKTPLTAVTTQDEPTVQLKRGKTWPMVAFVAATGVVAWAVMHFSTAPVSKQVEVAPPPAQTAHVITNGGKTDEITYTNVPTETDVSTGQGLLEIAAPGDSVILVDGTERGRGGATLPLWAGAHEVRISGAEGDHSRAIEVRSGRVAHVKF